MADTTPLMLITNAGLAAASRALPEGPYIHIVKFQIGSAFGYTPDRNQTSLQGNILYGGDDAHPAVPSDYRSIGDNTLNIILEIPPEAGPWEFGEVGIFAEDENHVPYLFGVAVFSEPQTKFSSLGTNVVSSYRLNCLLRLEQSVAVFQIDTIESHPYVLDVFQWSDVYPPSLSADPDVPIYNIRETTSRGDGTLLATTSDSRRTLESGGYEQIFSAVDGSPFVVQAASNSYIEVTQAQLGTKRISIIGNNPPNRSYLVQTNAGFWRSVSSISVNGSNYRLNLNVTNDGTYNNYPLPVVPQIGEGIFIYSDYMAGKDILYEQIIDPPSIPLATTGVPGLATAGHGLNVDAPGVLAAYGLLHQPSQNSGTFLSSGDLNNLALDSGLYTIVWGNGHPANGPYDLGYPETAGISFHLMQICPERGLGTNGGSVTQLYMPLGQSTGGQPIFWRACLNGVWGAWVRVLAENYAGSGAVSAPQVINLGNGASVIAPADNTQRWFWQTNIRDGGGGGQLTIQRNTPNGSTVVANNSRTGGAGYGRWNNESGMCAAGDTLTLTLSDWSSANIVIYHF